MMDVERPFGEHLKSWRQRRHLSQLDLALNAEISPRHLSFVETGRSRPSREMVLRLAKQLNVPLRERNVLLMSAGYAPTFPERAIDDPSLSAGRRIVEDLLAAHAPFPALAVDRHWSLVAANKSAHSLLSGVSADLLAPPANVLRISLHPNGLAPRIVNLGAWRAQVLERLRRQIEASADVVLRALLDELSAYPGGAHDDGASDVGGIAVPFRLSVLGALLVELSGCPGGVHDAGVSNVGGIAVPFRLSTEVGVLDFITTTTIFGTPVDVTMSELAIESFFPANAETGNALRRLADS